MLFLTAALKHQKHRLWTPYFGIINCHHVPVIGSNFVGYYCGEEQLWQGIDKQAFPYGTATIWMSRYTDLPRIEYLLLPYEAILDPISLLPCSVAEFVHRYAHYFFSMQEKVLKYCWDPCQVNVWLDGGWDILFHCLWNVSCPERSTFCSPAQPFCLHVIYADQGFFCNA